jgi:hypothetical protein
MSVQFLVLLIKTAKNITFIFLLPSLSWNGLLGCFKVFLVTFLWPLALKACNESNFNCLGMLGGCLGMLGGCLRMLMGCLENAWGMLGDPWGMLGKCLGDAWEMLGGGLQMLAYARGISQLKKSVLKNHAFAFLVGL